MGLFDFLMSAKSSGGEAPEAQSGLMGKLNYGNVPFGVRLMAAAEALRTIEHPDISRPSLALLARSKEQADIARKEAERLAQLKEKADRLADKVELSNPALAEALRADPTLVDEYGKGIIADSFESARSKRDRAYQIEDRNFNADLTREGYKNQADLQADRQAHDFAINDQEADIAAKKLKAEWDRDDALRRGRKEEAAAITKAFFGETGVELSPPPPELEPRVPQEVTPQPIPAPQSGSIMPPEVVPGLTQPAPSATASEEQGDAGEAPPQQVAIWQKKFGDPALTPTEAAQLTYAFTNAISASIADGKDPDTSIALGAAAEVYRKILDQRTKQQTADAATSEADTKATEAAIKRRVDAAGTAEKAIVAAEQRATTGDDVLDAGNDILKAMDPKNADYLPATGAGAWLAGFAGDLNINGKQITGNARAIYTAVKTIEANLGFDALQAMRDASPTGGALGQIAVQELEMLQSTKAKLDPTDVNFKSNLEQVLKSYAKIKEIKENYASDIENLRKYPSEEHKREFDEMYGVDAHLKFMGE